MKLYRRLIDPRQAHAVLLRLWDECKPRITAGEVLELTVQPEARTGEQNAKFHAICSDLAKSGLPWAGKARTAAQWKVLLVSGHAVATKAEFDLVPGLENEFVNLRESTALMSKKRGSSLIEYSVAFCAANGVELQELEAT